MRKYTKGAVPVVTYQVRIAAAVCTFLMIYLVVSWELLIFAGSYTIKSRI